MNNSVKIDDIIFNFFKQICDEKDDQKTIELGNNWIKAMETNLDHLLLLTSTTKVLMEQGKLDGYDLHDVTIVTEIIRNLKKNSTDKKE